MSHLATRDPSAVRLVGRLSRADLLWLANTSHGPGAHWHARPRAGDADHDHLAAGPDAARYLADHRVPVPAGPPDAAALADLRVVRELARRLLRSTTPGDGPAWDPWTPDSLALLADARFAVGPEGGIATSVPGWAGFARDLLVPFLDLAASGVSLGACSNPACRLVFEDGSRNHGRRWCDTAGCGNRDRVRRARRRSAVGGAAS